MKKMRSAITLLITLSVIATMIALMGMMFKYLDIARSKAEIKASMIQANLLSADVLQLLHQVLGKRPSKNAMQTLYETPLVLRAESGEFSMSISCKPLLNRINIIWLGLGSTSKNRQAYALSSAIFDMLTDKANLRDASLLREKITVFLKTVRSSTFGIPSRINKKKSIITFEKFRQLLDDYRFETDDDRVYRIPWQRYFYFGANEKKIDADFVTSELLAFLYDVDPSIVRENYKAGELNNFLSEIGESRKTYGWLFSEKVLGAARCRTSYAFRKGNYGFSFNYIHGGVESFEFFEHR